MDAERGLCVVAGAGPGVGMAVARRFAREGFDIALLARDAARLQGEARALQALGVQAEGHATDLASPADITRAFDAVRRRLGEPRVLVYNAARWNAVATMTIDPARFHDDLALGVTGALACAQCVWPAMQAGRRGSLLFTGGGLALAPQFGAGVASLAAAKAALRALVYALHRELDGSGVRVGTVTIAGTVAPGTAFDPDRIAEAFWALHAGPGAAVETVYDGTA